MIRRSLIALAAVLALLGLTVSAQAAPKQVTATFGTAGAGNGELGGVVGGVAVRQSNGEVYVVDAGADRVQRFDADGGYLGQFGTSGTGDGEFTFAGTGAGIAIDQSTGSVYVADVGNSRIERFSATGTYEAQFGTPGSGDGEFASPVAVAVDPTSHKVFVADRDNNRIQRFSATGAYEAQFGTAGSALGELAGPSGLAVDSAGSVYVLDSGNARVQKFGGNGAFGGVFASADLTLYPQALAVDPSNDHVLVSQYAPDFSGVQILEFTSAGNVVEPPGVTLPAPGGIDQRSSSGRLYSTDLYGSRVMVLDAITPPDVTVGAPTAVTPTTATLNATINPHDGPPVTYRFETSVDQVTWTPTSNVGPVNGNVDTPVSAAVTDLVPNTLYHVRMVTSQPLNPAVTSTEATFTTAPAAPAVRTQSANPVTDTTASLGGAVNPYNSPTVYWIEYGTTTAYGTSLPAGHDGVAGAGGVATGVTQRVTGLTPGTTYHFRLVASNATGQTVGEDRTFRTDPTDVTQADSCSNAAIRAQQHAESLPDCRAYEMVSPVDKGGSIVNLTRADPQAGSVVSPDGDVAAWASYGGFGGAESAVLTNSYRSVREADGWQTRVITPRDPNMAATFITRMYAARYFSDNASTAVFEGRPPLAPGDDDNDSDVYSWHLGQLDWVSSPNDGVPASQPERFRTAGLSANGDRVVFESLNGTVPLVAPSAGPAQVAGGQVYERRGGRTRIVGVDSNGALLSPCGAYAASIGGNTTYPRAISSRSIAFYTPAFTANAPNDPSCTDPQRLYLRRADDTTLALPVGPLNAEMVFLWMSKDGDRVLFSEADKLTSDAPADGGIYLYDASQQTTRFIVAADRRALVIGAAEDAQTIFLQAFQKLTPGATLSAGGTATYVIDHGELSFVAGVTMIDGIPGQNVAQDIHHESVPPDGSAFVFVTADRLAPIDNAGKAEVYRYDTPTKTLSCLSCRRDGRAAQGDGLLYTTRNVGWRRNISDDGRWTFFESEDPLVADDRNNAVDVYEYDSQTHRLRVLTHGEKDSYFVSASSDGSAVFFSTTNPVLAADRDGNSTDLYAARVGGGFLAASREGERQCGDDGCQGTVQQKPSPTAVASPPSPAAKGDEPEVRPRLVLTKLTAGQRSALAKGRTVKVTVKVNRPGVVKLDLRGVLGRASLSIGQASRVVPKAATVHLPIRISQAARSRLRHKALKITMSATFTGVRTPQRSTFNLKADNK